MEKISTSKEKIIELIRDLFVTPRTLMNKWSLITNQTAQVRLAYLGQHLASIVTGIKGFGTAARGDDLQDGTEVKTCSRVDQLGICRECGARVMRNLIACPECGSKNIEIKIDSHWIFSMRGEEDLKLLLSVPRIILTLLDREEEETIRIRMWELEPTNLYVQAFFKEYFYNNFLVKLKRRESKIAPCNLHPLKYDFYLMDPRLILEAKIIGEKIDVVFYDLKNTKSEDMPSTLLRKDDYKKILTHISFNKIQKRINGLDQKSKRLFKNFKLSKRSILNISRPQFISLFPVINQELRKFLTMRPKKIKKYKMAYTRPSMRKSSRK